MRTVVISILVVALAYTSFAAEQNNTFASKDLGISIEVPISKESETTVYQVAMFFLPASDGFAANVNIQRQKYSESIEAYDKLSASQFKELKLTVLNHELKGNEILYEYKGEMQAKTLHGYARSIKHGEYVYLATATCLDSYWEKQKGELMKSIDSFKANN